MMDIDGARDYSIRQYAKNGIQYVRIAQTTSRTPEGKPVLTVRARLRLPPTASPHNVALDGLCSNNGKHDPFIIAVTGSAVDSVGFQATHAWRFEVHSKALHEIPPTGVICGYVSGED
jgi:hypothetical protein